MSAADMGFAPVRTEMSGRSKIAAIVLSIAIHSSGLLFFLNEEPPKSGAVAAGLGGIEVDLGPAGGAPGGQVKAVEASESVSEVRDSTVARTVEATETVTPVTETVPQAPVQPVETVKPVETKPVEPVKAAEPIIAKAVEPVPQIEPVPPAPVKPTPPRPQVAKAPPPPKTQPAAQPKAEPNTAATAQAQPPGKPTEGERTGESRTSGAAGQSGNKTSQGAGNQNNTAGGGMPGSSKDYLALVQAWLERHKEYPRRAQLRRIEGQVTVRFVMDREGNLLSFKLERGSGFEILDNEAKAMVQRASPFPPLPAEMQQAQLELVVPVSFFLR